MARADILIVDDMPDALRLLSSMLSQQGYEIRKALTGKMALTAVATALPDLILLDIKLPDMSGYEVCQQLKANRQSYKVPIIFISALNDVFDKVKAFSVGGVDYIAKPFQFEEVLARVENQLRIQFLQKQLTQQNTLLRQEVLERAAAERALRRSNALLEAQQEAAPEAILAIDENRCIAYYNQRFRDFWRIPESSFAAGRSQPSQSLFDYIAAMTDRPQQFLAQVKVLNQYPNRIGREEIVLKDGRIFDCYSGPVRSQDGDHYGRIWYFRDMTERKRAEMALRTAQRQSEGLLLNILPQPVAEKLKQAQQSQSKRQSGAAIAEHFSDATILFADIVDFTPLAARTPPTELVTQLNQIFSVFDRLTETYKLEKIKTVGDEYMVAGGLPVPHANHPAAVAQMALDMQRAIADFQRDDGLPFQIRIGINTGPVVAGVIGIKKFIYDLWGDTVNIASRMESQGEPNRIQVTPETYERIKDRYVFEERHPAIAVKGKGDMATYWLIGPKETADS